MASRGIRRTDRRAQRRDCALSLDDEREGRRRGDEVDELAEERLLLVLCVVLLRQLPVDLDELPRAEREAAPLDAREDLAGEAPLHRVGLDQDQ